jgi:hypothetical protein
MSEIAVQRPRARTTAVGGATMQGFDGEPFGDPFLDDFQALVELARTEHRARAARLEAAVEARATRARELEQHVIRRFTALAATYRGSDRAVEYTRIEPPADDDVPMTQILHWRATHPFRKLEATVSARTGRYWLRVVAEEAAVEPMLAETRGDDIMSLTVGDVDDLIRRLADQQAWQGDEHAALGSVPAPSWSLVAATASDERG